MSFQQFQLIFNHFYVKTQLG